MLEFLRRNQVLLTSGCLLLISLILVSSSSTGRPMREPVSTLVLEGARPLQSAITQLGHVVSGVWRHYAALVGLRLENEALRQRILELEQEAVRLAEIEQTNRRLENLLGFRESLRGEAYVAQIIGKDPSPWFRSFVVNKGSSGGVRKGMAVLSPYGVVGQVIQVSPHASRVLLITDHNSGVDALVQRSRARGIVEGAVEDGCVMKYLKRGEDMRVGDRVVTSGFDGIFPKGVVIGHVKAIPAGSAGLMQVAEIEPTVPFDRLEEVLVVESTASLIEESS